jgi:hypothetical protein
MEEIIREMNVMKMDVVLDFTAHKILGKLYRTKKGKKTLDSPAA